MTQNRRTALVVTSTGSTLSLASASALARRGFDIAFITSESVNLHPHALQLQHQFGIHVAVINASLGGPEVLSEIKARLIARQIEPAALLLFMPGSKRDEFDCTLSQMVSKRRHWMLLSELGLYLTRRMHMLGRGYLLLADETPPAEMPPDRATSHQSRALHKLGQSLLQQFANRLNITLLQPSPPQCLKQAAESGIHALLQGRYLPQQGHPAARWLRTVIEHPALTRCFLSLRSWRALPPGLSSSSGKR